MICDLIKKISQQALLSTNFQNLSVLEKPIVMSNTFIIGNYNIHIVPGHVRLSAITDIPKNQVVKQVQFPLNLINQA